VFHSSQNNARGCFLFYHDIQVAKKPDGVMNKVRAQLSAFDMAGIPCDLINCKSPETFFTKGFSSLPLVSDLIHWPDPRLLSEYTFVYIRRPAFISKELIKFMSGARKQNPTLKILLELPTYPYDHEMSTPLLYAALIKDRLNRNKLRLYVDRIVTMSPDSSIFGTTTIPIINGVDLSGIAPKQAARSLDTINIVSAALFQPWHGIDRLIEGLARFYADSSHDRNIILHLAGDGGAIRSLKRHVRRLHLSEHVLFHGYCDHNQLNELYDECSLAVECLGLSRKSLFISSSLKSREYLAKGIPFLCANEIDVFIDNPVDFCMVAPNDETPIDIERLVNFHDRLYNVDSQSNLISRIRSYAESHVGIDRTMTNVINYVS